MLFKQVLRVNWLIFLFFVILISSPVSATMIDGTHIDASGVIELIIDSTSPTPFGDEIDGEIYKREGGVDSNTFYDETGVTYGIGPTGGTNPRTANFSKLGDGFGIVGNAVEKIDANTANLFRVTEQFFINLWNTGVTDTYQVTLGGWFQNSVFVEEGQTVDLDPAFSHSVFSIQNSVGNILFSTDLLSNNVDGNIKNGSSLEWYGGLVEEQGDILINTILQPGESETFTGVWSLEGNASDYSKTYSFLPAEAHFLSPLYIKDIVNLTPPVPEPATMLLFGFGLLGLAGVNRKKK